MPGNLARHRSAGGLRASHRNLSKTAARIRALVTGASGWVGSHLASLFQAENIECHGLSRSKPKSETGWKSLIQADLVDRAAVSRAIRSVRPDVIVHLAGSRNGDLDLLFRENVETSRSLFEAVGAEAPQARMIVTGSAAEYGDFPKEGNVVPADQPLQPRSLYGIASAAKYFLARHYMRARGLSIVYARMFNLVGPGEPASLVCGAFARQIVAAERAGRGTLRVGSLDSSRDFLDVRDATRALVGLARHPSPEELYPVCSGKAVRIRDLLELFKTVNSTPFIVEERTDLPNDRSYVCGDIGKLKKGLGFSPEYSLSESLRDLLASLRRDS